VWSTPTVDLKRNAVYVSTGDNYSDPPSNTSDAVLALDRATGQVLWSQQLTANDAFTVDCVRPEKTNCPDTNGPDFDFGQPPILASLADGKQILVIGQKSAVAHALDPDTKGKILWQTRVGNGSSLGGMEWGSAADQQNMYVALSDISFRAAAPDPEHPGMRTFELDPEKGGGVFALDLATGKKVWSALPASCRDRKKCSPAQMGAVSVIPGIVFAGSVDAHLRAYSAKTGEVVWDFDTAREYDTVNGEKGHGGSIDAGGPAIVGGMVYVYSGYAQWGGLPGNVLLAFGIKGK
jgi:polyvinyl alcohol dehydrogenase (cytochrome)